MPVADSAGPRRLRANAQKPHPKAGIAEAFVRLFTSRRRPRYEVGDGEDESGPAGAMSTAPLLPRTPALSGAAARRIEDYATPEAAADRAR